MSTYRGYEIRKNVAGGYEVHSSAGRVTEMAGLSGARRAIDALVALGSPLTCDVVALLGKMADLREAERGAA